MWKSAVGHNVAMKVESEGDDWETDADFENDVSEQEQRWGSKTIEGSGRKEHISVAELRQKVSQEHAGVKRRELEQGPKASYGYGGKFGVENDRMDKVAMGNSYVAEVEQHSSQTDGAQGFGGKYGVQKERVDKSAMGYDYKAEVKEHASQKDHSKGFGGKYGVDKGKVDKAAMGYDYKGETEKHQSQKDYSKGFGGKYGVEKEKVDKAAMGYDYKGETEKHQSQKDYSKGFGGKYGVEKDKVDKAALGYDYKGQTEMHQSQKGDEKPLTKAKILCLQVASLRIIGRIPFSNTIARCHTKRFSHTLIDYTKGFGGRYGVETDRMDKSASTFTDMESPTSAYEKTQPLEASTASAGAGNLKARFENMARASDEENRKRADEEKARRQAREKREQEEAKLRQQEQISREEVEPEPEPEEQSPPPPLKACKPPQMTRALPQTPRDEPKPVAQEEDEPEYEEPPCLPPRSTDLLEDTDPEPEPEPVQEDDDPEYEDIGVPQPEPVQDGDADYEDIGVALIPADDSTYEELPVGTTAIALYDYQGQDDDELSFDPDDIITNIEMVDESWWKGTCHGRTGLFPANYVQSN
ncbi:src substrate protein p85-like isoform X2 [Clupea harengus]|uniref:Src substrate protein p85-like isoform X2 n=1 Tax=Clupea harengus TaxID=7950 RepID=A0A8M1KTR9_CLUHA|nr:src substrate protein p85-like isoform X2 [Clupea harengus]